MTRAWVALAALAVASCVPNPDDRQSSVTSARVLGVFADPPEVKPGATVRLTGLFASARGEVDQPPVDWAICNARKPLSELGPVNPACFTASADFLVDLGSGAAATGVIPTDACRNFGPALPVPTAGEPAGRPVDPDPSGGYFQPVRLRIATTGGDGYALAEVRLACGLPSATSEQTIAFNRGYHLNENPTLESVTIVRASGERVTAGDDAVALAPNERVRVIAAWPSCPTAAACGDGVCSPEEDATACPDDCATPHGCGGAERYLRFDPATRTLGVDRETMRVSWFSAGGAWDEDHAGTEADDPATSVEGGYVAPASGAPTLWIVVRDGRGGSSFRRVNVTLSE